MTEDPGEAAARDLEEARAMAAHLLPEGVDFDDEITLFHERVNGVTQVSASMPGAKITLEVTNGFEGQAQALVMGLPVLVATAYDNMEGETE